MKRSKDIILYGLACIMIIFIVSGVCLFQPKKILSVQMANNYEELKLLIEFSDGSEEWVDIWQDETETYYFFLPAGADTGKVTFGNLKDEDSILLNNYNLRKDENVVTVLSDMEMGQILELQMQTNEKMQEPVEVCFLISQNIASIFIDTASGTVENIHSDKNIKEKGALRIIDSGGKNSYSGVIEYIKTRGNSTWELEKKPYRIKLEKEASLLDMPSAKQWILLANAIDDTLIKNEIVFRYAEKYTSIPSIRGQYIDLYLNNMYVGNYYLCEKVEVGKNRLNIFDLEKATESANNDRVYDKAIPYISEDGKIKATAGLTNPVDISGGFLVEYISDREYKVAENAFMTNGNRHFAVISPSKGTVEQIEYICGLFNEMETAMEQEDGINPITGKHFSEYMDIDSWASKYVMEEVFHDPDAAIASMFFYKDCDGKDPLIYCGPMWDYDRALGSYGLNNYIVDDAKNAGGYGIYVDLIMKHKEVSSLVYKKFKEEMVPYVNYKAKSDIYELSLKLDASAEMDDIRWPGVHGYYKERIASTEYLSCFLEEKVRYLEDVWLGKDDYCTVDFLDYYGNIYASYKVKYGERLQETPIISSYEAIFAGWYIRGEDIPYISGLPVLSDVTYESRWIGMDILIQNGLGASETELYQVDPEILENMADMLRKTQEQAESNRGDN